MKISMKTHDINFDFATAQFIKHCEVKNLSKRTTENYISRFNKFLTCTNVKNPEDVTREVLEDYIMFQKSRIKERTINSDISAIRTVLYYFMDMGWTPKFRINLMKIDKTIKETYSQKELEKLLKKPNLRQCQFTEYRVWVLTSYLIGTGNRIGSTLEIKIGDIDFDNNYILLKKTKQRKQQIVPLTKSLVMILHEYLNYREGSDDDFLFCSSTGDRWDLRTCQQQVAKYNNNRGVEKTSIHLLRHTFASEYIKNGGDIYTLSKLLGHSSVAVTENYIHCLPCDFDKRVCDFNPLEKIQSKNSRISMKH